MPNPEACGNPAIFGRRHDPHRRHTERHLSYRGEKTSLSLAAELFWGIFEVTDSEQVINYGLNKVRFPAAAPVDSAVGATATVTSVDPVAGGYQLTIALTFDVEGIARPVCVCEMIIRYLGDSSQTDGSASNA